jgi:hypothetical protein
VSVPIYVVDEFSSPRTGRLTLDNNGTVKYANCTFLDNTTGICLTNLDFFDAAGTYYYSTANVTDRFGTTPTYEVFGNLDYYALIATTRSRNFLTFSGSVIGVPNVQCDIPIRVLNTGNQNIYNISITAYDLVGATDATKRISASAFRAGFTLADSVQLVNGTAVQINVNLPAGSNVYKDINVWVSAPANTTQQYYSPSTQWSLSLTP